MSTPRRLTKSRSARDVMKKVGKIMGSLHGSSNPKSGDHVELLASDSERADEFGEDDVSIDGDEGSMGERRESSKENFQFNTPKDLKRVLSVEIDPEDTHPSVSPASPTSVVPALDVTSCSDSSSPESSPRAPSKKLNQGELSREQGEEETPEQASTTDSGRKSRTSDRKSRLTKNLEGDSEEAGEEVRRSSRSSSSRSLKKTNSGHSSKRSERRSSRSHGKAAEDASGRRKETVRRTKSVTDDDPKEDSPSKSKRSLLFAPKSRSMRSLNIAKEDLGYEHDASEPSQEQKSRQSVRKTKSFDKTSLSPRDHPTKEDLGYEDDSSKQQPSSRQSVRKSKSFDHRPTPSLAEERPTRVLDITREDLGYEDNPDTHGQEQKTRRSNRKTKSGEGLQRQTVSTRTTKSFDTDGNKPERKDSGRRRSMTALTKEPSISITDLTDEKWQRRRSKSRTRITNDNDDEPLPRRKSSGYNRRASVGHAPSATLPHLQETTVGHEKAARRTKSGTNRGASMGSVIPTENALDYGPTVSTPVNDSPTGSRSRRFGRRASTNGILEGGHVQSRGKASDSEESALSPSKKSPAKKTKSHLSRRASMGSCAQSSNIDLNQREKSSSPRKNKPRISRRASMGSCETSLMHGDDHKLLPQKTAAEGDKQACIPVRQRSTTDISKEDTRESTMDSCAQVGRQRQQRAARREQRKLNRSKSLRGLKDLRTKMGHSSNKLSPKACNQSVTPSITPSITSGSISSLTMSSRMFYDDTSLSSSQRSSIQRSYSTPKLLLSGEMSSSSLQDDDKSQDQLYKGSCRWESLPQNKNRASLDCLPVVPNHDAPSLAGSLNTRELHRNNSDGARWSASKGTSNGKSMEGDVPPAPPIHNISSHRDLIAPDTPSIASSMGMISELTPATFYSGTGDISLHKDSRNLNTWMSGLSNLLLDDSQRRSPHDADPSSKRDSIPRRVRRHSFDASFSSLNSGTSQLAAQETSMRSSLLAASSQLDAENDNAPRRPARQTSDASSVLRTHQRRL